MLITIKTIVEDSILISEIELNYFELNKFITECIETTKEINTTIIISWRD